MNTKEVLELRKKSMDLRNERPPLEQKERPPWESEGSFEIVWELCVFIWRWVGAGSAWGPAQLGAAMRSLGGHQRQPPKPSHVCLTSR